MSWWITLDKKGLEQARKYGKTKEEKSQSIMCFLHSPGSARGGDQPVCHAQGRRAVGEVRKTRGEQGSRPQIRMKRQRLLGRMPKLEAYRKLRKQLPELADGR